MLGHPSPRGAAIAGALLGLLALAWIPGAAVARKSYSAESYRTDIRLQEDGSLRIQEEVRVRFTGGPFTFFYRGLPLRRTAGIDELSASDSIQVKRRRSRIDVTWRFPATRDTVRTFRLAYTARGALALRGDRSSLRWWAFPQDRAYVIEQASAAVVLPPGGPAAASLETRPRGRDFRPVLPEQAAALLLPVPEGAAVLALGPLRLEDDKSVVLRAEFSGFPLPAEAPAWQVREDRWRDRLLGVLVVTSFLLTLGLFWVLWSRAWLIAQLDRGPGWSSPSGRVLALTSPPEGAPPAVVAGLTHGVLNAVPVLAGLFDLGRRGLLRFEAAQRRFAWSSPPVRVRPASAAADLPPWDRLLLERVASKADADGTVRWSRAGAEAHRAGSRFLRLVRDELIRRGDLDPKAIAARRSMYMRGTVCFGLAAVLLLAALAARREFGPYGVFPGLAATLVGIVALVAGGTLLPHTAQGAQRVRSWRGFARFLKEASKGSAAIDTARFHDWLPYAVALGVAPAWVKAGRRWGLAAPDWFRTSGGDPGEMTALIAVVTAASTSGGAGGAGGAGGGGASGAG